MNVWLNRLLKISSIFSAVIGPILAMLTGFKIWDFGGQLSENQVITISGALCAGIVQGVILLLQYWYCRREQFINVYIAKKRNDFDSIPKLTLTMKKDSAKLYFRIQTTGRKKYIEKRKLTIVFPNQVQIQANENKEYFEVDNNTIVVNMKKILDGQNKRIDGYNQEIGVALLKNDENVNNEVLVKTISWRCKVNQKTKVRLL